MSVRCTWPLPDGIKLVDVNGYPMAYRENGSGTPLILVHGSMNDYRYWNSQTRAFAEQYRVIAVSLRHYFPEPWDGRGDDFSILQHADDVAEFMRRLNLGPVHLLGHSRGGAVVLNVAARHLELIRSLRGQSRHMSSRHREHRRRCDPNEVGRPKHQLKAAPSAVHDNFVERRSRSIYKGPQTLALS